MKKSILISAICLFSAMFYCRAQTHTTSEAKVSGLVIDSDSLFSIPGVFVYLLDVNQNIVQKTRTNTKGFFVFTKVSIGTYKVRTVALGYKIMISKKFEVVPSNNKYNYQIKINNLNKDDFDLFNEMDYDDYIDLFEDREVLSDDK